MAKKQTAQSLSLFEPISSRTETSERPSEAELPKIKDACPRCNGRSLKTVRSYEHDGHTHYGAGGCLSDDRTDAFYFTPQAAVAMTFAEQAEREEEKKRGDGGK